MTPSGAAGDTARRRRLAGRAENSTAPTLNPRVGCEDGGVAVCRKLPRHPLHGERASEMRGRFSVIPVQRSVAPARAGRSMNSGRSRGRGRKRMRARLTTYDSDSGKGLRRNAKTAIRVATAGRPAPPARMPAARRERATSVVARIRQRCSTVYVSRVEATQCLRGLRHRYVGRPDRKRVRDGIAFGHVAGRRFLCRATGGHSSWRQATSGIVWTSVRRRRRSRSSAGSPPPARRPRVPGGTAAARASQLSSGAAWVRMARVAGLP